MSQWKRFPSKVWLVILLLSLVIFAVACGTAATPTPVPTPNAVAPAAPVAAPTPTPTLAAVPKAAPTPTPVQAPAKKSVELTWLVANFGNERFDYAFGHTAGHDYMRQLHAFLISSDVKEGRRVLAPGVATNWELSKDGLTWTLTIRKGVKFHDGRELTAEDVAWSLLHIYGPEARGYSTIAVNFERHFGRIEQTAPNRVDVTTTIPLSDFYADISEATGTMPGIVYPKRATLHDVQEEAAYDRNPVGAGIMKLVKHVPAAQMTFERFDDYYYQPQNGLPTDKRVNFDLLDMRLVPEEATRVAALRAGEADIAPVSLVSRNQVEAGGGRLVFGREGVLFMIQLLGCWKPEFPCHDRRVRQALNYAIDKELIRDRLYGGPQTMQVKGWFVVTPSTIGYTPDLDPWPFDPVKARQLLADAGYPGGKGFGKLIVNTWVSPNMPLLPESAQLGAEFWKRELGLDVEVKVGDRAATFEAYSLTEEFHGQILWRDNESRLGAGSLTRSTFGPSKRESRAHEDPELHALTLEALVVFDPLEQENALNSLYRRLREEAYLISIGYINIPWGVGPRIRSWEPYPIASYPNALHTITLK